MIVTASDVLIDALGGVQPSATWVAGGIETRRLAIPADAAELAASAGRRLADLGQSLSMADLATAGICLSLAVPLLTRNGKHFDRIEGLRLEPLGTRDHDTRGP